MESIQEKYGTIEAWSNLIQRAGEPDIKALKFFYYRSYQWRFRNRSWENRKESDTNNDKKAGRILTEIGLSGTAGKIMQAISDSIADPKTVDPEVHEWVKFFNARTKDTLEMAQSSKIEAVKKAANIVLKVNADDKTRIEAEQRENAVRSYQTDMEASRKEGKIEVAKSSLKIGLDYETISAITGLSVEEIEKLR